MSGWSQNGLHKPMIGSYTENFFVGGKNGPSLQMSQAFLTHSLATQDWNINHPLPHLTPSLLSTLHLSATLKEHLFAYSCSDFGYFRPENDSKCVEQPELKGHDLEFCLHGREEHLTTSG